jgi:transposase-like protein
MHGQATKAAVRAAFISGEPLARAAERHGVDGSTARRWVNRARLEGDDWRACRASSTPAALAARLEAKLDALEAGRPRAGRSWWAAAGGLAALLATAAALAAWLL